MANSQQYLPTRIISPPGIKRDGTMFEGDAYVDGLWCRFERGLPRKIGGYRSTNKFLREASTGLLEYTRSQLTYIHTGSANYLERFTISGVASSVISDRTPASGFTRDSRNIWQFAVEGKLSGGVSSPLIIAQVAPNADCLCNDEGGKLFSGDLFATTALTPITLPVGGNCTGGVLALHPYTIIFGNDGYVAWSVPNDPTDFAGAGSGSANITGQKIVRGLPLRGGPGSTPSGLLWSADSLLRMSFTGGSTVFAFDTISSETTILSPASVIEYDGIFYWVGTDRFLAFNGVVREIPNVLNIADFFDNLNMNQRMKVFAFKVTRFGEIWWAYPRGDSEVCNHAIIYNVRENTWYDTPLPNGGRSAGLTPAVYRYPLLAGSVPADEFQAYDLAIAGGGAGYTAGDVLRVVGGSGVLQETEITVNTVVAGAITAASITSQGLYGAGPSNPVSVTGGTGAGATFNLTYVQPYKFWIHETGYDEIDGENLNPIASFFETADICFVSQDQPLDAAVRAVHIEPDFVQSGPMTVQVKGRANARAPEEDGDTKTFQDTATSASEQIVTFKEQRRQLRFRFSSDCVGGFYQMGHIIGYLGAGDSRITT